MSPATDWAAPTAAWLSSSALATWLSSSALAALPATLPCACTGLEPSLYAGMDLAGHGWRLSSANQDYGLCPTYPQVT